MPPYDDVMRPAASTQVAGFAIVIIGAAMFGMLGPLSRFAYDAGMEPLPFVAWRAAIGLVGTLAFVAWRVSRSGTRLVRPTDLRGRVGITMLVAGIVVFTLSIGTFTAFGRITVALALLGFYTFPAMIAVVAVVLGHERLDRARGVALVLATAGMAVVVLSQLDPESGIRFDILGFGFTLVAAVSQTIFVTISRAGYRSIPTDQAMSIILVVVVVLCIATALVIGGGDALRFPLDDPSVLPLLLFAGIFAGAIPSILFLAGIRLIGGTRAGILMLVEPVIGVALAAWLLGEALGPLQAVGGAAILGAAVILQRASASGAARALGTAGAGGPPLDTPVPEEEEVLTLHAPGGP